MRSESQSDHKFPGSIRIPPASKAAQVAEEQLYEEIDQSADLDEAVNKALRSTRVVASPTKGPEPALASTAKQAGPSLRQQIDRDIAYYDNQITKGPLIPAQAGFPSYVWPGICLSDIARDTGLSLAGVSRIFSGDRKPKLATLRSIAALYTEGNVQAVRDVIRQRVLAVIELNDKRNAADPKRNPLDPKRDARLRRVS